MPRIEFLDVLEETEQIFPVELYFPLAQAFKRAFPASTAGEKVTDRQQVSAEGPCVPFLFSAYSGFAPTYARILCVLYLDTVLYLNVTLAGALSWDEHVNKTIARVNSSLYRLNVYKHLLSQNLRTRLVATLLILQFDYCCTLLTDITGNNNLRLQRTMNNCLRFIYQAKGYEHITPF